MLPVRFLSNNRPLDIVVSLSNSVRGIAIHDKDEHLKGEEKNSSAAG